MPAVTPTRAVLRSLRKPSGQDTEPIGPRAASPLQEWGTLLRNYPA